LRKSINKLKAYRMLHALKQEEVAKHLGMSLSTYNCKENGSRKFTVDEAKKVCDYFGVSIEEIFFNQSVNM
jgi:putative transcriptional regulator